MPAPVSTNNFFLLALLTNADFKLMKVCQANETPQESYSKTILLVCQTHHDNSPLPPIA